MLGRFHCSLADLGWEPAPCEVTQSDTEPQNCSPSWWPQPASLPAFQRFSCQHAHFTDLQSVGTKSLTFSSLYHFKDDIIASCVWNNWLFHHFLWASTGPAYSWPVATLDTPNACRFYFVLRSLSHLSKQRDLNIWLKSHFWLQDKCELFRNAIWIQALLCESLSNTGNTLELFWFSCSISLDFFFHLTEKDLRSWWITNIILVK